MRKLLSLGHWRRVFTRIFRLLRAKEVSLGDKLLFTLPVALYWVLPNFIPFLPIDDIAVTMVVANWFAARMERKYSIR